MKSWDIILVCQRDSGAPTAYLAGPEYDHSDWIPLSLGGRLLRHI